MADFFDKLKQGIGKGVTTVSVKSKEMMDTNRVKSQMADLERQKKDTLAALGASVCQMLADGRLDEEVLRTACAAVLKFDEHVREKQVELVRIHEEAQQALDAAQQPIGPGVAAHCTNCGKPIIVDTKFCGGCGKLIAA
jgi:hypothetical protein